MLIQCLLMSSALSSFTGVTCGLECWQCIADDCQLNPANNYKAFKVRCRDGESCQKVVYKGRDYVTQTDYHAITRSCSQQECLPHVDNCTENLLMNPGCMTRYCCPFSMCNNAPAASPALLLLQCAFVLCATLLLAGIHRLY
ncbi:hypothetical protein CAPTEDRAFT_228978 [Capitella teleta]|uniref:UPAR/Ly6 domain-containing protein n=1 Tax=Capitella teleta TaxID=283909 RepID=R7TH04_CAPTE|nr:hypothetical protein CAPTEDRAFT_228978 [Capitella teleta]|eukprot:ELT90385.1 hypothetical protein CAPTEDRAFT_228978 [Capitella teleta]